MSIKGVGNPLHSGAFARSAQAEDGLKMTAQEVETRLREAAAQFEAVFVQQMLASMRATVPEGGLIDAGQAEDLFAGMLDQHMAEMMAGQGESGLADAIYRQLSKGI